MRPGRRAHDRFPAGTRFGSERRTAVAASSNLTIIGVAFRHFHADKQPIAPKKSQE